MKRQCEMNVLFVASYNSNHFAPFILEQAEALQRKGCNIEFFGLRGKGILGYLLRVFYVMSDMVDGSSIGAIPCWVILRAIFGGPSGV